MGKHIKLIFLLILGISLVSEASGQELVKKDESSQPKIVDGIAAVVNGEIITISEVEEAIRPILEAKPEDIEPGKEKEIIKELKSDVLKQMIEEKLLLKEARDQGLALSEEEIERAKEALLIKKLMAWKMKDSPEIIEAEIIKFYEENKERFLSNGEVKARHIFFRVNTDEKVEWLKTEARARRVLDLLSEGKKFEDLARKYSEDEVSRDKGGDLGYIGYDQTIPEFEDALFSLKKAGEISDLIKTPHGYHIIKLEERKENRYRQIEEVREEIREILRQQKKEKEFNAWIENLKAKSTIEVRVK